MVNKGCRKPVSNFIIHRMRTFFSRLLPSRHSVRASHCQKGSSYAWKNLLLILALIVVQAGAQSHLISHLKATGSPHSAAVLADVPASPDWPEHTSACLDCLSFSNVHLPLAVSFHFSADIAGHFSVPAYSPERCTPRSVLRPRCRAPPFLIPASSAHAVA